MKNYELLAKILIHCIQHPQWKTEVRELKNSIVVEAIKDNDQLYPPLFHVQFFSNGIHYADTRFLGGEGSAEEINFTASNFPEFLQEVIECVWSEGITV